MCDKRSSTEGVRCHPLSLLPLPKYAQTNQKVVGVKTMVKYNFTLTTIFIFLTTNPTFF